MADPLERAVDARIDSFRPGTTPPFAAVQARKRSRDRRRLAVAATALVVVAAGSAATAGLVRDSGQDRLAGPGPDGTPAPTVSAAPGPDDAKGPAPRAFTARPVLPSCGTHEVGQATVPAEARECLAAGAQDGRGAELVERMSTVEGDPIVTYTRALPDGSAEVFRDATADAFGDQVWTLASCARVTPAGAAEGCGTPEILLGAEPGSGECPTGDTSTVDYVDFVRVGAESYGRVGDALPGTRLGVTVLEVHCELAKGARRAGDSPRSGDAAYLPVGTAVRQVVGFDPRFRLAVEVEGRVQLLERTTPASAGSSYKVAFPGVVDRIRGVVLLSQRDGTTEVGRVEAQGGVERVRQALAVGYYAPGTPLDADVFVGLELDDGTVVSRAYDSRTGVLFPGVKLTDEARAVLAAAMP